MQAPSRGEISGGHRGKMGKYMKKSKAVTRDVSPLEASPHSSATGVRTRAKTLALQRLRRPSHPPPAVAPSLDASSCPFSYLQLRSRRLRKPCLARAPSGARKGVEPVGRRRAGSGSWGSCDASCSARTASLSGGVEGERGRIGRSDRGNGEECGRDAGVDASFGENDLEIGDRDRSTRESTPCSLMRDLNANTPPGSTTRQQSLSTAHRTQMSILRSIPASDEMEEFFACAERRQQRSFLEKYNFDIVRDLPLPGRFEWAQVIP
ncbi:cyclin-dependent kinase inhibitor 3-like [Rhodamnia argentea]|uniref:Cyclin-dependent kinase inhibitor 3-like n=1 Tax=Rhodamnia argentea TaxID=178133 RepID=A0A8B8PDE2_9MYRT|nr:cyclin-dependent kinase inhibitor 3-like [Rhodamnia argentea]